MSTSANPTLLFLGTEEDRSYLPKLKSMVGTATVFVKLEQITTLTEIIFYCKKKEITGVLSTSQVLLSKLLAIAGNPKASPSLDSYSGSYFTNSGIEFVFLNPLEQLISVPYGAFVTKRLVSKLVSPEIWTEVPKFDWCILDSGNESEIFTRYQDALAIAVDIETFKENLVIRCIGYTAIFIHPVTGIITTHSCVLPLNSMYEVAIMRKFNWQLKAPKIFQNGKYDISYLSRYNAVPYNYLWDTAHLFHSWYSELPKDLAFLGAFFVRKAMYWKDLANTNDIHEYYRYNALDTWTTANVWIAILLQMPQWAKQNYSMEFPLVFPCHLSEMTGIKRDMERLVIEAAKVEQAIVDDTIVLSKMVGVHPKTFNVNSSVQNKSLRVILGCGHYTSSDETHLKKIGGTHPLNKVITNKILDIRGNRKLGSTYLTVGEKAKEYRGRILYSLNPHGTDTGRLASREHAFWCGLNIQNIPVEKNDVAGSVKSTIVADEGFMFFEIDLEKAESWWTAYVSGDKNLIAAVTSADDFHSMNASAFFGIPYEDLYDNVKGKTKNKPIRDLAKRTNHGANYNMGANMMVETMGDDKVWEAKRLLKLPVSYGLKDVTEFLLKKFHEAYPGIKGTYYTGVVSDVLMTKMLVGANKWTRYCFGKPKENKLALNALVAHVPQSGNASNLNKAYMKVFYELAISEEHKDNFKLCAQIHDSILCQVRIGHEYLAVKVKELMEIPVTIKGYDGITRTFTVPASIKGGKDGKGAKYWSDTES